MQRKHFLLVGTLLIALLLFPLSSLAADFTITTTDDFDKGLKIGTTTESDRYNLSSGALELDYPLAHKDNSIIGYWRLEEGAGSFIGDEQGILNGTFNNPRWLETPYGTGTYHYDIGDHIYIPNVNLRNLTQLTLMYLYKANSTTDAGTFISDGAQSATSGFIWNYRTSSYVKYQYAIGSEYKTQSCNIIKDTDWHIYAITADYIDKRITSYIENLGSCSLHIITDPIIAPNSTDLYFANYNSSHTDDLEGVLDEIKIYNRTLSESEIVEIYNSGNKYKTSGTWTSPNQTMAAGNQLANTTILYSNVDSENYIDKIEWLVDETVKATHDTNMIGELKNSDLYDDPSLVSYWRFENNADDEKGLNNGSCTNCPAYTSSGKFGGAYDFDGSNDDLRMADSPSLSITGTGLTLSAWIKPDLGAVQGAILHKDAHYAMFWRATGAITYADSITWNYATIGDHGNAPAGEWSHVAVTFDGSTISFYVNGENVGNKARAGSLSDNNVDLSIGSYNFLQS
ncbi:LamG-like jellyroll fold domain-containing protein, partial [Candidatus Undinarchaeota archaeon]